MVALYSPIAILNGRIPAQYGMQLNALSMPPYKIGGMSKYSMGPDYYGSHSIGPHITVLQYNHDHETNEVKHLCLYPLS